MNVRFSCSSVSLFSSTDVFLFVSDSFSVGGLSAVLFSVLSSIDVEIVSSVIAWIKSIRICLGSVIPEYNWLVRNGGSTQKDSTFLCWFG